MPEPLAGGIYVPNSNYPRSPTLSLLARRGGTGIGSLRLALRVLPGVDSSTVRELYAALLKDGAQLRL